jgi:hypothetical protein
MVISKKDYSQRLLRRHELIVALEKHLAIYDDE